MDEAKILEALTVLANKLGVTAEYLWAILVKQGMVQGWNSLVWLILFIVFGFAAARGALRMIGTLDEADMGYNVIFILLWLAVCICILGVFTVSDYTVYGIFNPEYLALKQVMSLIK